MYAISVSYGNDSMAMIQWAHEVGLNLWGDVYVVYCDTGWAQPGWETRIAEGEALARRYGFTPVQTKSMGMAELVRMKKGWPGNGQQFCTAFLKGVPFLEWIDEVDTGRTGVILVGKRRAESVKRRDTPEFIEQSEYHGDRCLWHPLYLHTDEDRDGLLARAGIQVLPHRSQECSPCVNANRGDFMRLQPVELAKVNELEVEIGKPMFRPKRYHGLGIYGVAMWARHGKHHEEPIPEDEGCGAPFGCGL